MSLPDTIFIFVLALIIFGPKKLPEIGRQIGRLVGEFRRASNEFKFQIEEELRQVDLNDRRTQQQAIAAKKEQLPENRILEDSAAASSAGEAGEALPVGQHPNIENLDASALNIEDAQGSEPRTVAPYAYRESVAEMPEAAEYTAEIGKGSSTDTADSPDSAPLATETESLQPSLTHADANHG